MIPDVFRYVPEPYKTWVSQRKDILSNERTNPELDRENEIQHIQDYLRWNIKTFPEYGNLLNYIITHPTSEINPRGIAGVRSFGRIRIETMNPNCRVSILIPAKDEQDNIYRTLEGYANQYKKNGTSIDPSLYEINILINVKEGEQFDKTFEEVERFKKEHPDVRINFLEVVLEPRWARMGFIRKLLTDITLYRYLIMKSKYPTSEPLYLISDDADLVWVDPKQVATVIETFDLNKSLDIIIGYQEKYLRLIANSDFIFLSRRFWDLATQQAFHYLLKGKIPPEQRNFEWSRPFTYGTNCAFTANVYALIGGYDWDAIVAEDLDIGRRISLLRGTFNKDGKFIPILNTHGLIRTRNNSSPRRFIWGLLKNVGNIYSSHNFQNGEVRKMLTETMMGLIPEGYKRITEDNKRFYEKELWFLYESLRRIIPDINLAKLIARRSLVLMGFKPEDIEVTDTEIHILNSRNFANALERYRKIKGIRINP
jgi:hypothetical protein